MATGSYVYRDAYYGQRLILSLSRSGSTVRYTLQLQSTGSMYANVAWSLGGAVSRSGSTSVSQGSAFTVTLASGSFTSAGAASVSASATMFWGGQPSVSASVAAGTTRPAAPSGLTVSRQSGRNATFSWNAGARASDYGIQTRYDDKAFSTKWYTKNRSFPVKGFPVDTRVQTRVFSRNAAGNSGYSNTVTFYTTPKVPTNVRAALTADGVLVSFKNNARYPFGVEVERENGSTVSFGTGTGGSWSSADLDTVFGPDLRFRVRAFVGPESSRAFSDWSAWSNVVQGLQPPLAPSNLSPNGGYASNVDASPFSWQHNPADGTGQEAAKVRFRSPGGSWAEYTLNQGSQSFTPDSGQWAAIAALGGVVEWEAATKGLDDSFGPWSATATVTLVEPPAVDVTSPVQGVNYEANYLTVQWLFGQADDFPQQAWRARLLDEYGQLLEEASGSGAAGSARFATLLEDETDYLVEVRAQAVGVWSAWETVPFTVVFVPPMLPEINGAWDDDLGGHALTVVGGELADGASPAGEPPTVEMVLERSTDGGGTWFTVTSGLSADARELTDFQGLSFGDTFYRLTAYAATGASAETVLVVPAQSAFAWLAAGPAFDAPIRVQFNPERSRETGRARSTQAYLGRAFPVAYAGENLSDTLSVGGTLIRGEDSAQEADLVAVAQAAYPVHLWRDPEGHHAYVSVGSPRLSRENHLMTAWSLSLVRVDDQPILEGGGL